MPPAAYLKLATITGWLLLNYTSNYVCTLVINVIKTLLPKFEAPYLHRDCEGAGNAGRNCCVYVSSVTRSEVVRHIAGKANQ